MQGNGDGPALIGVYDLVNDKSLGNVVANENFDLDDHNSPNWVIPAPTIATSRIRCLLGSHQHESPRRSRGSRQRFILIFSRYFAYWP